MLVTVELRNDLYHLFVPSSYIHSVSLNASSNSWYFWHKRLGHLASPTLKLLIDALHLGGHHEGIICDVCHKEK